MRRGFALRHGDRSWQIGGRGAGVMGVVNVTPDSFYGGSRTPEMDAAVIAGLEHARSGASVLDVGGESTRPGAAPVAASEEEARVVPVIRALAARVEIPIAVDTYKAEVARAAVAAGASLINDVSGGLVDAAMAATVASLEVPVVLGHLRGTPATMQSFAVYDDAPSEVAAELLQRVEAFLAAGVARDRILLDPGIGFAKRTEDNREILRRLAELTSLDHPVVIGVSRKRFLGEMARRRGLADDGPADRLEASLAAAVLAAERGALLIRTHDVLPTVRALAAADAILHGL